MMRSFVVLFLVACSAAEPPRVAETADPVCLPLVPGCGCAYDCAFDLGPGENGTHRVRSTGGTELEAERTTWCDGQASLCDGGRLGFYDRTPCGGECIPTRAFDGCHMEAGACVP